MAKLRPEDIAPPKQAWAMRLILIAILLFGALYVLRDSTRSRADILTRWLADRVMATGEIRILAQADDRVHLAFQRAQAALPSESSLIFISADNHGRKYEVHLTAPKRDQALAQLQALLARFQVEYGGDSGRDLWTFSSPYLPPVESARVLATRRLVTVGLLLSALAALAAGIWLYRQAPPAARARMREMLDGTESDQK